MLEKTVETTLVACFQPRRTGKIFKRIFHCRLQLLGIYLIQRMGITYGKLTREHRLPWLAITIAFYRQRIQKKDSTLFNLIAKLFQGNSLYKKMIGDIVGVYLIVWALHKAISFKRAIRSTTLRSLKDIVGGELIKIVKLLPGGKERVEKEFNDLEASLESSLKDKNRQKMYSIPEVGMKHDDVLTMMKKYYEKEKPLWYNGYASGAVYHGGNEHLDLQVEAYRLFSVSNPLHPDMWPSVMQFEAEVVSMTANLLGGGNNQVCGTMTSGGTESIFLAAKTHRHWAAETLGITQPEIVAPETAHAAINKACEILGIKLVQVPVSHSTFIVDPRTLEKYITSDTIMIFASAPQFPHGVIDPIEDLGELAMKYNVGLHVDSCLGGFVLPFARKLGYNIPKFDFELAGVTSMSCDTHKYGFAAKGTSIVLYHSAELRQYQYFTFPNWPGGLYATPSIAGSRAGALIAACWASLVSTGEDGFLDSTRQILECQGRIKQAICETEGLELCGNPNAMVVAFQSKVFNVYNLSAKLSDKGWALNNLQNPPCVHICITLRTAAGDACDRFCSDIRECSRACMENPNEEGKFASLYGMASAMPAGPVRDVMRIYNDIILKV